MYACMASRAVGSNFCSVLGVRLNYQGVKRNACRYILCIRKDSEFHTGNMTLAMHGLLTSTNTLSGAPPILVPAIGPHDPMGLGTDQPSSSRFRVGIAAVLKKITVRSPLPPTQTNTNPPFSCHRHGPIRALQHVCLSSMRCDEKNLSHRVHAKSHCLPCCETSWRNRS